MNSILKTTLATGGWVLECARKVVRAIDAAEAVQELIEEAPERTRVAVEKGRGAVRFARQLLNRLCDAIDAALRECVRVVDAFVAAWLGEEAEPVAIGALPPPA